MCLSPPQFCCLLLKSYHLKADLNHSKSTLSHMAGIPNLRDLMPDDLRWSWCNNNRNKVHNKCNGIKSSWNHCHSQYPSLMPKQLGITGLNTKISQVINIRDLLHNDSDQQLSSLLDYKQRITEPSVPKHFPEFTHFFIVYYSLRR